MKTLFTILILSFSVVSQAEIVGIKASNLFREHKFLGLETKCTEDTDFGCRSLQILVDGQPITRSITEEDFNLDTEDFGRVLDLTFNERVTCKGGDQLKWPQRTHVNIRYCANRDTPILIGKTFLFLLSPGQTAIEFYPGKRKEFKEELQRIDLTFTYVRAIMFRDREILKSEKDAKRIAEFLRQNYAP